jgi:hypothetical protein
MAPRALHPTALLFKDEGQINLSETNKQKKRKEFVTSKGTYYFLNGLQEEGQCSQMK